MSKPIVTAFRLDHVVKDDGSLINVIHAFRLQALSNSLDKTVPCFTANVNHMGVTYLETKQSGYDLSKMVPICSTMLDDMIHEALIHAVRQWHSPENRP